MKTKLKIRVVLTALILVLGLGFRAAGNSVNSNSVVKDNIEYYLQTDKAVYNTGEDVQMLYRVTNLADETVLIGCSRSPEFNFWVQNDAETVWTLYDAFWWFSPGVELSPGQSEELSHIWDMNDDDDRKVEAGMYNVVGLMYNEPWNQYNHGTPTITEVSVPITILSPPTTIWYVADDGSDNNDGLTPETAFATIQKGIDSAHDGDTVLVADGTYTGEGNRDIDFLGKAITLRSESGPENCIIDCESLGRGFYFHNFEKPNSVLRGLTIQNGRSRDGGGIHCKNSSPTIIDCIIMNSVAEGAPYSAGGGIYCYHSNPEISQCYIIGNSAKQGGGVCLEWYSGTTIKHCVISGNTTFGRYWGGGGGLFVVGASDTIVKNCLIFNNSTYLDIDWSKGGGIYLGGSNMTIENCTFFNNSAHMGGAFQGHWSDATFNNCILWGNNATAKGAEIAILHNSITVTNSDIMGGKEGIYLPDGDILNWESGNIDVDPCFVEAGYWDVNGVWVEGDYHLLSNSPCIDAGDPNYIPEPNETDLDGNPRIVNDRIDMGAYEYIPPIPAEIDVNPKTLNVKSKGNFITCRIRLPEDYDVAQIEPNSVLLEEEIPADRVWLQDEFAVVKFSRSAVQELLAELETPAEVELLVSGELSDGSIFEGTDIIRVIDRGRK